MISNGDATDEVWLDRSWDGGKTWDSKLGDTRTPPASRKATTTQWNLDKGAATSAVRACGKAGNRPTGRLHRLERCAACAEGRNSLGPRRGGR